MATQKRRIVYLSDEEWEDIRARAERLSMSMSAYIRSSLIGGNVTPIALQRVPEFRPVPKPTRRRTPEGTR